MKSIFTLLFVLFTSCIFAQHKISGKILTQKGVAISGANVFIEGSYDGALSDENGNFSFETELSASQVLSVTALLYEPLSITILIESDLNQQIKLRESVNVLDAVIITAGTFEAGDRARVSVLKPLDIVTTAGSSGDIYAALQTLPGTQTAGESGRLFVRGGESDETQTYIDGVRVSQPYGASADNLPARGRFSPFLFSGISFSTGGYSAEFGEALSGVLLLNTEGEESKEKTDISIMTVGVGLGNTQKWDKSSLTFNAAYTDLAPYQLIVPQDVDWNRPYQSLSGEAVYRYKFTNGLLKIYGAFDATRFDLNQIRFTENYRVDKRNNNFYFNSSYKGSIGNGWQITTGLGYGNDYNKIGINKDLAKSNEDAAHLKLKFRKSFSDKVKLSFGSDYFITRFGDSYTEFQSTTYKSGFTAAITSVFVETDLMFTKNLAAKVGLRAAHNDLLDAEYISPRISFAYKISKNGQFSVAYGDFSQAPKQDYLKFSEFTSFENEHALHYILNYQYSNGKQTFRAETYYKRYDNLVKFDGTSIGAASNFDNSGSGFAKGVDLFWRDEKSIKNLEYWVSYSYIDSERDYRNFEKQATPSFVANHNLSVVTKYWINGLRSQLSLTQSLSSGRPYDDPNSAAFMSGKTKAYSTLNLGWAYLLSAQKILYFSMSNVLNHQNVFGYEYSSSADSNGDYERQAIRPAAARFVFVGFFWTISDDKKSNQLDNL